MYFHFIYIMYSRPPQSAEAENGCKVKTKWLINKEIASFFCLSPFFLPFFTFMLAAHGRVLPTRRGCFCFTQNLQLGEAKSQIFHDYPHTTSFLPTDYTDEHRCSALSRVFLTQMSFLHVPSGRLKGLKGLERFEGSSHEPCTDLQSF